MTKNTLNLTHFSQEDFTLRNGFVMKKGTGLWVLTRACGVSDEFFTRGKEFVPERYRVWDDRLSCLRRGAGFAADIARSVLFCIASMLQLYLFLGSYTWRRNRGGLARTYPLSS